MSGRALRRTFPSICTRTDRKKTRTCSWHIYPSPDTLAFLFCTGVRDVKVHYDACMWTLYTIQDVNVCRINVDAKKNYLFEI